MPVGGFTTLRTNLSLPWALREMLIGVPREIKPDEHRVALTPAGTEALTAAGHEVLIEADAGLGSGFTDDFYAAAGAENLASADDIWSRADMILKVKEPIEGQVPSCV